MAASAEDEFKLLSALSRAPLGSYAAWAEALGWTPSTVRRRVLDLRARGVFEGFAALPTPDAFGLREVGMAFYPEGQVPTEEVFAVEGVISEAVVLEDCQYVVAYGTPTGLDASRARLTALFGVAPEREVRPDPIPGVAPDRYGALDWRVMRAFIDAPRSTQQELATATGLAPKTAIKRRDALLDQRAMQVWPLLRSGRAAGPLYFHVTVWGDEMVSVRGALAACRRHTVVSDGADPPMVYAFCQANDVVEMQRIVKELESAPGIRNVGVVLTLAYHVATDRVRGLIDAEIARWRAVRGPAKQG